MSAVLKPDETGALVPELDTYPLARMYRWRSPVEDTDPERVDRLHNVLRIARMVMIVEPAQRSKVVSVRSHSVNVIHCDEMKQRRFEERYLAMRAQRGTNSKVEWGALKQLCAEFGISYRIGQYLIRKRKLCR